MAENWKNCFEEELICPICLHVFVEPVQLPCKHNFCRGCIGEAWAKESGLVRCPECNQAYNQKPNLEKNLKLTNIVEKFNSLNLEKTPSGHSVCDVEIRRNEIREREQDIEEQLYKLESDKRLVEEKVSQLKDEVRLQYEKMHQILDEDLRKTMEILDKAQAKFCNENAAQVLHLNERMQEAKKLLSSVQVMFDKTEDINFMKNTKSVKILMDRTQNCTGGSLPPPKIGHLNSKLFLNEIAKKEKQLRKLLEGPLSTPVPFLQSIPMYPCTVSNSGAEKRKHSTAFPEGSFLEPSSGTVASQYIRQGAPVTRDVVDHIVGLPSGPQPVHSGSVFNPSHYPNTTSSQQSVLSQYGGRKILVCSVDNCYCSSVSNHSGHQPYPR
ncbi:PREDICTED: probable E3 ubiquitin-protein ligase TRIM8, partial [Nestor notabilis]|uniref:probable E3 ubiquitin-protein ligase TRIM8 n=1 Tax=Nestor notabilis TaxID=176057 RepID=UPI00052342BF